MQSSVNTTLILESDEPIEGVDPKQYLVDATLIFKSDVYINHVFFTSSSKPSE